MSQKAYTLFDKKIFGNGGTQGFLLKWGGQQMIIRKGGGVRKCPQKCTMWTYLKFLMYSKFLKWSYIYFRELKLKGGHGDWHAI